MGQMILIQLHKYLDSSQLLSAAACISSREVGSANLFPVLRKTIETNEKINDIKDRFRPCVKIDDIKGGFRPSGTLD